MGCHEYTIYSVLIFTAHRLYIFWVLPSIRGFRTSPHVVLDPTNVNGLLFIAGSRTQFAGLVRWPGFLMFYVNALPVRRT